MFAIKRGILNLGIRRSWLLRDFMLYLYVSFLIAAAANDDFYVYQTCFPSRFEKLAGVLIGR